MAVLPILIAPHPVLAARARRVEAHEFGPELARRLSDMAETMYAAPGVGLAGPQVGDGRRLVVLDPGPKSARGVRFFALVNPEVVERAESTIDWDETCLSVPDVEVKCRRIRRIRVAWQAAEDGAPCEGWFSDYEAVIVQHELDHLEGTVLLDKVSFFTRSRYLKRIRLREAQGVSP